MIINFYLPENDSKLIEHLKIASGQKKRSLSFIVREALEYYLLNVLSVKESDLHKTKREWTMKKAKDSRQEARAQVDLPLLFTYEDKDSNKKITSQGKINDLSINGMKVDLPLSAEIFENNPIDFDIQLPHPFKQIKGQGKIQWKRWDAAKKCTTCGLKLETMTLRQLTDIDIIISEVLDE